MPSIKFFRFNVGHAAVLIILLSFFSLNSSNVSIQLSTFREYSVDQSMILVMGRFLPYTASFL